MKKTTKEYKPLRNIDLMGDESRMYFDISEYAERIKERQQVIMSRTEGFFKRVDEVFDACGIKAVLHNKIPDKCSIMPDPGARQNSIMLTLAWKPKTDITVIAKLTSAGYSIPYLIPDEFISPNYPMKYHLFDHHFELAVRDGDGAFSKLIEVPVQGRFEKLPDWFTNALLPLVPKA